MSITPVKGKESETVVGAREMKIILSENSWAAVLEKPEEAIVTTDLDIES